MRLIEHDAGGRHLDVREAPIDVREAPIDVRQRPFRHVEDEVVLA
jgi:hypothetical protein